MVLDETASNDQPAAAFDEMEGLLLTGGADLDPSLYGEESNGATGVERGRDELELEAWTAAREQAVPVLGICRGFQALNVFAGGQLTQHVEHHRGVTHELMVLPGTRLAAILGGEDGAPRGASDQTRSLRVNSTHHQAVRRDQLAPGLRASGYSGELVEALESTDAGQWLVAVQCHPERTATTPPEFDRLWDAFVEAATLTAARRR